MHEQDEELEAIRQQLAEVTRERDALTEELKSAKHYGDHQRAARLEAEAELSALKTEIGDPDDVEPDVIDAQTGDQGESECFDNGIPM